MTPRFLLLTFASCIIVFAAIWAATAPRSAPVAAAVEAPAVLYADCEAVRAANAAPLRAGQPGYRPALDGNMNGVACEPVVNTDNAAPVDTAGTDESTPMSEDATDPDAVAMEAAAAAEPAPEAPPEEPQEPAPQEM